MAMMSVCRSVFSRGVHTSLVADMVRRGDLKLGDAACPPWACEEREVVLASLACDGDALRHASGTLRADRSFIAEALDAGDVLAETLRYASDELRGCKDLVLRAVRRRPSEFEHAAPALKADPDVLGAVLGPGGLTGHYQQTDMDFMWHGARVFRKRGSQGPHDYWVQYGSGACLASSVTAYAARFDPASSTLHFARGKSHRPMDPWKVLFLPLFFNEWNRAVPAAQAGEEGISAATWCPVFVGAKELAEFQAKKEDDTLRCVAGSLLKSFAFGMFGPMAARVRDHYVVTEYADVGHGACYNGAPFLELDGLEINDDTEAASVPMEQKLITATSTGFEL
eukprot:Rhum_TRINITY_DN4697_c0_g1::Rhum_TRINITY_DN4697_c0_g1_i1::g.15353::m.15353